MEEFLLVVILFVLLIRWWVLSRRFEKLERQIAAVWEGQVGPAQIAALVRRIHALEGAVAKLESRPAVAVQPNVPPAPEPEPEAKLEPVAAAAPMPAATPEPEPEPAIVTAGPVPLPIAIAAEAVEPPAPAPVLVPAAVAPVPPPPPGLAQAGGLRHSRNSEEWEALIGGNWLNKLGNFVLVVGVALLLALSYKHLGPASRSAIGLAISAGLLAGGVFMERRARYVIFGRGLIGGGWAGLYFTTYAMQALDAAKVIDSPLLGGFLLLAVAAGMVAHSLRYRAQALTGLAYTVAFATLAITPVTALSVTALIPLAASLLVVAYQFSWSGMALFGLIATYATCASRGDTGAPLSTAQTVFAAYWLAFEIYDLLRARRGSNHGAEQAILPLNALCFAGLSYAKWSAADPARMYLLAAGIAAAYLADTILRAVLRPPSTFPAETRTEERIFAGGYEGPITLAAASSVIAALLKLHGQTANVALLAEAELLFLAGFLFRQDYPRRLAGMLFAALGAKLLITDIPDAGSVHFVGRTLHDWTPTAMLAAALCYTNRALRRAGQSYGYAASALIAVAIGFEISMRHLGIAWLGWGTLLFAFGWRFRLLDFRLQAYGAGVCALGAVWLHQIEVSAGTAAPWASPWIPLAAAAAVTYAAALCALRSDAKRFAEMERPALQMIACAAASAAAAALVWRTVPAVYLGPAWMALGIVALEAGLRRWPADLRTHAHVLAAMGVAHVLYFTVLPATEIVRTDQRLAIACAALASYLFAARFFAARPDQAPAGEARGAVNVASAAGSLFVLIGLWAVLNPLAVAPVWALFALLLMEAGFRLDLPGLRLQGHLAAAAAAGRLFWANFAPAGSTLGISHRLLNVGVVVAAEYFEWWRQGRWMARLGEWERALRRLYLWAAAGLMMVLLYVELPRQSIEVGWAVFAVVLLALGRARNIADLRLQSYGFAAIGFMRALGLELYPYQILSCTTQERIAATILVIACLFAGQLLIPLAPGKPAAEKLARLYYSLLATTLATVLLYQEVSGRMLTVAWGIEGAALLAAGFPLRDRTMRLSGLALFLVCIGKLFFYDLRELETLYRILSFIVLGVILVSVSWVYTRFRDLIQRYL